MTRDLPVDDGAAARAASACGGTPDAWLTSAFRPIGPKALNAKAAMSTPLDRRYVLRAPALAAAAVELAARFDVLEIEGRRSFPCEICCIDGCQRRSDHGRHPGLRQRLKRRLRQCVEAALRFVEARLDDGRGVAADRRVPDDLARRGTPDEAAQLHARELYEALHGCPCQGPRAPGRHVRYRRITLLAREGSERMTIDAGIHFFGGHEGADAAVAARPAADEVFIVETQSARGCGIADAILRRQQLHPTGASCCVACLEWARDRDPARRGRPDVPLRACAAARAAGAAGPVGQAVF